MSWILARARRPSPATVISIIALVVASAGFAVASIPGPNGAIKGCANKKTGALRAIDSKKKCKSSERTITWNQRGQQGPQGAKGDTGATGTPDPSNFYSKAESDTRFLSRNGDLTLVYVPTNFYVDAGGGLALTPNGHFLDVKATSAAGVKGIRMPLDMPESIFGESLKITSMTVCFKSDSLNSFITTTFLFTGQPDQNLQVIGDTTDRQSTSPTCYTVTPTSPASVGQGAYVSLSLVFANTTDVIELSSVKIALARG